MICQVSGELTFSIERHRLDRSKCARAHTHERPARRASDMHSWALDYSACTHEYIPNLPHKGAHACIHHMGQWDIKTEQCCSAWGQDEQSNQSKCAWGSLKIYIYIFKKYILWLLLFSQCKMRLRTQGSNAATYTHHGVVRLDTRCNAFAPPGDALLSLTLSLPLPLSVSLSPLWDAGVWLQLSSHSCWALLSCAHGTAELSFWNRCCSCCCCCCVTSPGGNGNIFCCNILNLYLHFFLKKKEKEMPCSTNAEDGLISKYSQTFRGWLSSLNSSRNLFSLSLSFLSSPTSEMLVTFLLPLRPFLSLSPFVPLLPMPLSQLTL